MSKRKQTNTSKRNSYTLRMARMLYAIEYLGRYCQVCGIDGLENPWMMDFDHINNTDKLYEVKNRLYSGSFIKHKEEIDKCRLVCSNCHRTHHAKSERFNELKSEIFIKLEKIRNKNGKDIKEYKEPIPEEIKNQIKVYIAEEKTLAETSKLVNLPYDKVKYFIKKNKLIIYSFGRRKIEFPKSIIIKLLNQRHSIRSIAKKTNINREVLRRWINKNLNCLIIKETNVKIYSFIEIANDE